jgi:hypothetical protein
VGPQNMDGSLVGYVLHRNACSASRLSYYLHHGAARSPCESHGVVNNRALTTWCHVKVLKRGACWALLQCLPMCHVCAPGKQDCTGTGACRDAARSVRAGIHSWLRTSAYPDTTHGFCEYRLGRAVLGMHPAGRRTCENSSRSCFSLVASRYRHDVKARLR